MGVNAYGDSKGSGTLWRWGCIKGKKKLSITTWVLDYKAGGDGTIREDRTYRRVGWREAGLGTET